MASNKGKCQVCPKFSESRCSWCKLVFYCSKEHQKQDWPHHKESCTKKKYRPTSRNSNVIETWDIIPPSDKLEYRADQGSIYNKNTKSINFPDIQLTPGSYKCAVFDEDNGTDEEPVMINLQEGYAPAAEQSLPVHGTISPNAFFNYTIFEDRKAFNLICCSSSSIPPDLYMISCTSKSMCDRHQRIFSKLEINVPVHGANRLTTAKDNCRKSLNISYAFDFPLSVRCIGDGVNYSDIFIFPLENNTLDNNGIQPYENWADVDPLKMMTLIPLKWDERSSDTGEILLYNDQNITFQCQTNIVYFAIGSRITLNIEDGKHILLENDKKMKNSKGVPKILLIDMTVRKDIESISCHAPVTNSNQWVTKTVKLQVMDGEAVNITESEVVEEIYWTLNDKSVALKCQFSGKPTPQTVEWRKDNQLIEFRNNTNVKYSHNMTMQNISILLISLATYDVHGLYECVIGNIYGNGTKQFRVFVRAPESSWIIFSASLGLISLAAILLLLGLFMRRQKKHLDVLKRPYDYSVD